MMTQDSKLLERPMGLIRSDTTVRHRVSAHERKDCALCGTDSSDDEGSFDDGSEQMDGHEKWQGPLHRNRFPGRPAIYYVDRQMSLFGRTGPVDAVARTTDSLTQLKLKDGLLKLLEKRFIGTSCRFDGSTTGTCLSVPVMH